MSKGKCSSRPTISNLLSLFYFRKEVGVMIQSHILISSKPLKKSMKTPKAASFANRGVCNGRDSWETLLRPGSPPHTPFECSQTEKLKSAFLVQLKL